MEAASGEHGGRVPVLSEGRARVITTVFQAAFTSVYIYTTEILSPFRITSVGKLPLKVHIRQQVSTCSHFLQLHFGRHNHVVGVFK